MEENTKHIAMIVHDYFEQAEMEDVRILLQQAGFAVDLIAPDKDEVHGLHHVELGDTFDVDKQLSDVEPEDYDAVVLPGGTINADQLRVVPDALNFVESMYNSGKTVAAICHAPWVLISLDIVEGKTLTSYPTLKDDMQNAGAIWIDQDVASDGGIITSRNPDDIPAFAEAIGASLQ
ncbi:MAG: type 1 glutamine amidotransferase domain-containing protein [Candidatus Saccharimonadales bacterium]